MRFLIPRRLIAPLTACGIAGAAAVIGGACLPTASADPQKLRTGNYVLNLTSAGGLPATITDSAGRRLRVIADTLAINTTDQTYEERSFVAITPVGGTEQSAASSIVSRRRYAMPTSITVAFSSTLFGGFIAADVLPTSIALQMPNRTIWYYEYR